MGLVLLGGDMSRVYCNSDSYKKINWAEISRVISGNVNSIRFNKEKQYVSKKQWKYIDDIIFKELPTFWYQYKLAIRKEQNERRRKANMKRKGIKYKQREKRINTMMEKTDLVIDIKVKKNNIKLI